MLGVVATDLTAAAVLLGLPTVIGAAALVDEDRAVALRAHPLRHGASPGSAVGSSCCHIQRVSQPTR